MAAGPESGVVAQSVTQQSDYRRDAVRTCIQRHSSTSSIWATTREERTAGPTVAGWYRWTVFLPSRPAKAFRSWLSSPSSYSAVQSTVWAVARKLDYVVRVVMPVASSRKHRKTPSSKTCVTRRVIAITLVSSWTTAVQIIARHAEVRQITPKHLLLPPFVIIFIYYVVYLFVYLRCWWDFTRKSGPATKSA